MVFSKTFPKKYNWIAARLAPMMRPCVRAEPGDVPAVAPCLRLLFVVDAAVTLQPNPNIRPKPKPPNISNIPDTLTMFRIPNICAGDGVVVDVTALAATAAARDGFIPSPNHDSRAQVKVV